MLHGVRTAEENDSVLPLIADPALATLHAGPLSARMHFEVRVLRVMLVENQLRMTKLTSDDKGLNSRSATA